MRMQPQRRFGRRGLFVASAILISLGILLLIGAFIYANRPIEQTATQDPAAEPTPVSVQANTLFLGNVYWGRYINDWSMQSELKTAYPFSRLNEFDRESYDAWIAGLECPTVAGLNLTSAEEEATLSFNCNPEYLPEAAKWFTAFTLANNHTDNQGEEGFEETKRHLDENGIQHFGHYDPYELNELCDLLSIPVKVTYSDESVKEHHLPMAFCGYHGVFKIPPAAALSRLQQYSGLVPTIAMPHMGVEYEPAPDQLKTQTYRAMIDNGADFVLGDHPHWVQSTEAYNGKLIVYSMGNFMFDQQGYAELTRSAGIRVVFDVQGAESDQLDQWLKVGESCQSDKASCFETIRNSGLSKLPYDYKFGVVGTDNNNKLVKPATEAQQQSILQRLNWSQTMMQLRSPQSSL